ncbi:methionyl-tRNA formyltransferase [Allomuricauda sp. M10]|jgi:Methionyl-tRNA formyltransferase|uniref:methionyl-tRNA formyltransferase n=1 Tax=Allomuricauda sp. M10 TaxID=2683292 RepID=UPI001D194620|nr:formyltransferase family protein [Muricauda sp. M10]
MNRAGIFLMTKKGLQVLESIIDKGFSSNIGFVVGASDKNVQNDYYHEIGELCSKNGIPYFDKDETSYKKLNVSYLIAISWRWIISEQKAIPLIVLHDSLLPKYRGFAPLVNSLINGEREIGVSALFASSEYDKGPIIARSKCTVEYPIKIAKAIDLITECYIELVQDLVRKIKDNVEIIADSQNEELATYSLWRDEEDYHIDWEKDSSEIKRFIDSVGYPYKGASAFVKNRKVRIFDAQTQDDVSIVNRNPGKVIFVDHGKPIIVCGRGLLRIEDGQFDDTLEPLIPLKNFRTKFI